MFQIQFHMAKICRSYRICKKQLERKWEGYPRYILELKFKVVKWDLKRWSKISYKEPLSGIKKKGVAKEYSDYLGSIGDM